MLHVGLLFAVQRSLKSLLAQIEGHIQDRPDDVTLWHNLPAFMINSYDQKTLVGAFCRIGSIEYLTLEIL